MQIWPPLLQLLRLYRQIFFKNNFFKKVNTYSLFWQLSALFVKKFLKSIQLFRKIYQKKRKEKKWVSTHQFSEIVWKVGKKLNTHSVKLLLLKNICLQPFQLSPKLQDLLGIDQLAIPEGKIKRMLTRTCLNQDWISNQFLIYVTTYSYGLSGTREAKKYWVGKTPNFLWTSRNFKLSWFHYWCLYTICLNIGWANDHPAHPLPGSLIMVCWVVEFQTRVS